MFFIERNAEFLAIFPESCITILSFFILTLCIFIKTRRNLFYLVSVICSLVVFCFCIFILLKILYISDVGFNVLYGQVFILDRAAIRQKVAIFIFSFLCLIFIQRQLKYFNLMSAEFLSLFLFSILGSLVVVSSGDFLMLYIGLELSALPIYALIALNNTYKLSYEAALKYFIMGCISSAFLLFGISLIYGLSGTLNFFYNGIYFSDLENFSFIHNNLFYFGPAFIIAGLSFKFGAAPFHMWVPDVYRGATSVVIMIIGTIPKIAAYAMMYRLLSVVFKVGHPLCVCTYMISFIAFVSLFIGNLGAVSQTNIKRLLGYSAISNMGFLFFGFIAGMDLGYKEGDSFVSSFFYLYVYLLSFIGFVSILGILSMSINKEIESIVSFKGLFYRSPGLSVFLLVFLFSLIGFPPLVGFYAKFFIILQLFYYGLGNVIILILLFSVIGAYYYLKIVKEIFFYQEIIVKIEKSKINKKVNLLNVSFIEGFFLVLISILLLLSGIFPELLLKICFF